LSKRTLKVEIVGQSPRAFALDITPYKLAEFYLRYLPIISSDQLEPLAPVLDSIDAGLMPALRAGAGSTLTVTESVLGVPLSRSSFTFPADS
jgi:hypothetical protein